VTEAIRVLAARTRSQEVPANEAEEARFDVRVLMLVR
jgi:hypothetical protein